MVTWLRSPPGGHLVKESPGGPLVMASPGGHLVNESLVITWLTSHLIVLLTSHMVIWSPGCLVT